MRELGPIWRFPLAIKYSQTKAESQTLNKYMDFFDMTSEERDLFNYKGKQNQSIDGLLYVTIVNMTLSFQILKTAAHNGTVDTTSTAANARP